jgi:hypothetical protein
MYNIPIPENNNFVSIAVSLSRPPYMYLRKDHELREPVE